MGRTIGNRGCYFSLACSIGSISIACGSLLSLNSYNDKISLQRGMFLTTLGFVYFISLTDFFNKYLLETPSGQRFRQKYRLMMSDVLDITNKTVSTIQAALSCFAGFIICNSSCRKSFLTASHFMSDAYAWFGTAYFIYDIWSMYKVHVQKIADKLKLTKDNLTVKSAATTTNGTQKINGKKFENGNLFNGNNNNKQQLRKTNSNNTNDNYNNSGGNGKNKLQENVVTKSLGPELLNATTIINGTSGGGGGGVGGKQKNKKNKQHVLQQLDYVSSPPMEKISFLKYCITHPIMIIHHLFLGSFGLLVIVYLRGAFGDCVYGFIYLMEFSTPYVSIRSILSTMGLKKSRIYIINGLIMVGTFFLCRILMWPVVYYWYSVIANMTILQAIISLPTCCKIGTLILFLPQVYWFYLMLRGAMKVFFPSTKSSSSSSISNATTTTKSISIKNNLNKKTDKIKIQNNLSLINNNGGGGGNNNNNNNNNNTNNNNNINNNNNNNNATKTATKKLKDPQSRSLM